MEGQATQQNEITESLSKAEQIKLQSLDDKVLHYDPQNPFLAIIGVDTDRLIDVFAAHVEDIFSGKKKRILYTTPFDISSIAYAADNVLLIVELPIAANKDKVQITENFLFYRDVVLERNMKMIVLCSTEIFNELHLKATDFISMSLETAQFLDFKAAKEEDLKESDTLAAAERELQEAVNDLEHYKKHISNNHNLLFEKFNIVINGAMDLSKSDMCIEYSFDMLNYAQNLNDSFFEMLSLTRIATAYFNKGIVRQSLVFLNEAIKKSKAFPTWQNQSYLLNGLANINAQLGNFSQAIEKYKEALKLAKKELNLNAELTIMGNLASVLQNVGDYAQALKVFQNALQKIKEAKRTKESIEPGSIANIYSGIAVIHDNKGEFSTALYYFHLALNICRKANLQKYIADNLISIGVNLKQKGAYRDALEYFNKAKEISHNTNNTRKLMDSYFWIASLYSDLGKFEEALVYLNKAQEFEQSVESSITRYNFHETLGELAYNQKHYQEALNHYQEAYGYSIALNFKRGQIESRILMAKALVILGSYGKAREKISLSISECREIGLLLLLEYALGTEADILMAEGDMKKAFEKSLEALSLSRKIQSLPEQVKNLLRIYVLYALKKETDTAQRYLNEAKSIASAMDNRDKLAEEIAEAERRAAEAPISN